MIQQEVNNSSQNTTVVTVDEPNTIDDEIERYFATLKKEEHIPADEIYGQRVLEKAESKYFEYLDIFEEKQKDIRELKEKITKVETSLRLCKNIKNVKKAGLNKERSIKRKKLRAQLAKLKMDLTDLEGAKDSE